MLQSALLAVLLLPGATTTQEPSGQDLLTLCSEYSGGDSLTATTLPCVSYVAGLLDAISNYETILEMTAAFDNIARMGLLARVGALPKTVLERLPTDGPMAKTTVEIERLQADALAKGATSPTSAFEGVSLRSLIQRQVCVPQAISSTGQIALVILKFLRDHPERLHEPRGFLAIEALKGAFPCPKEK